MERCSVLVTAYTNTALDNILLKLKAAGMHDFLRLGRPEAVNDELRPYMLGAERYPTPNPITVRQHVRCFFLSFFFFFCSPLPQRYRCRCVSSAALNSNDLADSDKASPGRRRRSPFTVNDRRCDAIPSHNTSLLFRNTPAALAGVDHIAMALPPVPWMPTLEHLRVVALMGSCFRQF